MQRETKHKTGFRERLMIATVLFGLACVFVQLCFLQLGGGKGRVGVPGVEHGLVSWKAHMSSLAHRIMRHL